MNEKLRQLTSNMELNPGTSEELVKQIQQELGFSFPQDYVDFITCSNGAEGWIGSSYLALWPIEEIASTTRNTGFAKFDPGVFLIGSDGAGEAYAFDTRSEELSIVEVPYVGNGKQEVLCGHTFTEFLEFIYNRWDEDDRAGSEPLEIES